MIGITVLEEIVVVEEITTVIGLTILQDLINAITILTGIGIGTHLMMMHSSTTDADADRI